MADTSDRDAVRDATDLVDLIGEHVVLKPRGREFVGLCPFHDDHRPSFAVVTHKANAFYKCHSCGAAGDAFTFVQKYHKMEFGEALRFLAERAGITLSNRRRDPKEATGPGRAECRKACAYAADYFTSTLVDPETGAAAREVIAKRGINDAMVESFRLGAAPDAWDGLTARLSGRASSLHTAEVAGLVKSRPNGPGHYDVFRNRLIFPICDETGSPTAFGGRIIDPEDEPKYLNSPESPVFFKSKTLFGLHLAKRAIIESKQAIITEGYTDVIACHQAGVTNVVGTLGTALTREHASILARLCDTVVVLFDGDEAGCRAADRAVEVFFSAPVDVIICVLPDGMDPDDLLKQEDGVTRFRAAIAAGRDALQFKFDRFRAGLDGVDTLSGRQKHLEAFLRELCDLGFARLQGVRKRLILTQLSDLLGVSPSELQAAMPRPSARSASSMTRTSGPEDMSESTTGTTMELLERDAATPVGRARRLAERELLALLLFEPQLGSTAMTISDEPTPVSIADAFGPEHFAGTSTGAIARVILPWLREERSFTMQEVLGALPEGHPAASLAPTLYFEAQQRCGDDQLAAATQIAEAGRALHRRLALDLESSTPEITPAAEAGDLEHLIRRRRHQGDRPDAIVLGVRSSEST